MINEQLKCKGKFQIGQFKSLKQIFCKFEGQFDLEGQGQVFGIVQDLYMINALLKFEGKIPWFKSCYIHKESHKVLSYKANLTLKVKIKVTSFQTHLRHLNA